MLENQALQNERLRTENMMKPDGKAETAEQTVRFEKDNARSRSQRSRLQELYQGLGPNRTLREALEERHAQLTDEKNLIREDTYATVFECFELWKDTRYLATVAEENRNLEKEMETLRAYKANFGEHLKSQQAQEDIEEHHGLLQSENHRLRRESEEIRESCADLEKKVKHQEMVQAECRRLEEEEKTLRGQNSSLKEEIEELESKLPQEDVEKQHALLKSEIDRLRWQNEEIRESFIELQKKIENQELVQEKNGKLEEEKETLRGQNSSLKEEIEKLKSKLSCEDVEKRHGLLKSEIHRLRRQNEEIRESFIELQKKIENHELVQEKNGKLEEEKETLRGQNSSLKEEIEKLKSKLSCEDVEKRHGLLKSEIHRLRRQNEEMHGSCKELWESAANQAMLREECQPLEEELEKLTRRTGHLTEALEQLKQNLEISDVIQKLADQSCSKMKLEAVELSKKAFDKEYTALNEYLKTITKNYNDLKAQESKYQGKIIEMESLKTKNDRERQEIDRLQEELINLKATCERYKHIDKKEADIVAINKKLLKKKLNLEKEIQTLQVPEESINEAKYIVSELEKENCSLYVETLKLKDYLEQKKLKKVHLKLLKSEEKTLTQRNSVLNKEISALDKVEKTGLVKWYEAENGIYQGRIQRLQHRNNELQSWFNGLYVRMYTQEVQKIYNDIDADTKTDITQQRKQLKDQIRKMLDIGGAGDPPVEAFPPGTPVSPST
ncbi:uncharacterized protein [Eucyclogobius newberryi]|uniref:uncharacterized protein n=1 Tax=Eucyclogobius newberryi TaxID=166745 RepID=UPI003B5CCC6C